MIVLSSSSASDLSPTSSRSPINRSGYSDEILQIKVSRPRLSKLLSVTPRAFVSAAPTSVPTVLAPLKILINVANKTASTPGGHTRAANTNVGRKAI